MQSELRTCPFCSEQCATLVIDQGDKWAHYEPSCLEVRTGYDLSDDAAWRAEAIAAWNTRASDAEITRLTEALRAAEERERVLLSALEEWMFRYYWRGEGMNTEQARIHAQSRMKIAALVGGKP